MLKVGCCGFPIARGAYTSHFPLVEVQHTFYQPPRPETLARWRAEAPRDFEFTLKAWQLVTHPATSPTYRRLREPLADPASVGSFQPSEAVFAAWKRTREAAAALEARLIVFQCPGSFTPSPGHVANMRAFFSAAARDGLRFLWEPRGEWPEETIRALCRELDLVHCVDPFLHLPLTPGLAYFRLHGIGGHGYRYAEADFARLLAVAEAHPETYVLFNNLGMFEDAERFQGLAARRRH
ncbi:MAG: DUF72 domain-containing protein [Proteobacteria bacterium]|nr:DUF72 domain-containing protein [Pseudomonadota bacterium]